MWDEEIDKKIKDAADQYHPAYDDNAWAKMEQMLDEHLPRKKDRRIIIYFLPLMLLLLGGGIFFVILHKNPVPSSKISEKAIVKTAAKKPQEVAAKPVAAQPGANMAAIVHGKNDVLKVTQVSAMSPGSKKAGKPSGEGNTGNQNTLQAPKNLLPGYQPNQSEDGSASAEVDAKRNPAENNSINEPANSTAKQSNEKIVAPVTAGNRDNNIYQSNKVNTVITKDDKETEKPKDVTKAGNSRKDANGNISQKKTKKNALQNFGIGLSVGPDVSGVKLSNTGKITLAYGAELNYSFTKKFTLRTGFYVASKIYSADEEEYHVPAGSSWNEYLQSVDANCKVYEIPLTLSYNFGKTKNHNWFASAGLSSYFMKREAYVYYYKNPAGVTWDKPWTITNQNKHYFSVLDISAGYEYHINNRFSLSAEPYVKLPLSGIGAGKIKLNSTGVLFTVAVKPF